MQLVDEGLGVVEQAVDEVERLALEALQARSQRLAGDLRRIAARVVDGELLSHVSLRCLGRPRPPVSIPAPRARRPGGGAPPWPPPRPRRPRWPPAQRAAAHDARPRTRPRARSACAASVGMRPSSSSSIRSRSVVAVGLEPDVDEQAAELELPRVARGRVARAHAADGVLAEDLLDHGAVADGDLGVREGGLAIGGLRRQRVAAMQDDDLADGVGQRERLLQGRVAAARPRRRCGRASAARRSSRSG